MCSLFLFIGFHFLMNQKYWLIVIKFTRLFWTIWPRSFSPKDYTIL